MSSQLFLGPTPISENNWRPPFRLATALLETAAGIGGILGSPAAKSRMATSASRRTDDNFFIAEILRLRRSDGKGPSNVGQSFQVPQWLKIPDRNEGFIAALKTLRHPKSGFHANCEARI